MSQLIPFGAPTGLSPREQRQLSQEIGRANARSVLTAADGAARVQAAQNVTEEAMLAATEMVALANLLVERTPQAAAAIDHIASAGLMAVGNIVMRTGRRCCE